MGMWPHGSPPPNLFTHYEQQAILGPSPVVTAYKSITVQGFEFKAYSRSRRFDSSAVWATVEGGRALFRLINVAKAAPCCHPDSKSRIVVEVKRFVVRHARARGAPQLATMPDTATAEFILASCLVPQVIVLLPKLSGPPQTAVARRDAKRLMYSGLSTSLP